MSCEARKAAETLVVRGQFPTRGTGNMAGRSGNGRIWIPKIRESFLKQFGLPSSEDNRVHIDPPSMPDIAHHIPDGRGDRGRTSISIRQHDVARIACSIIFGLAVSSDRIQCGRYLRKGGEATIKDWMNSTADRGTWKTTASHG